VIALDTNILARYILNDTPEQALAAEKLLLENECSVGWSVLVELCWVLESRARLSRDEIAASFIGSMEQVAVPDAPALQWAVDRYATGADFADMIHLVSAMSGSAEFACFDRKLARQAGADTPLLVRTLQAR
jgi:predicted nucleic-acid-binding protein